MKNKQTETKFKSTPRVAHLLTWIVFSGALILICSSAPAQNLFVTVSGAAWGNPDRGSIVKFTPNGTQSTFAIGLNYPRGSAFDSAGNLFVADVSVNSHGMTRGTIYKLTPAGVRSIFASGLTDPSGLTFDSTGSLFVADNGIYKFSPAGVRTT